MLSLHKYTKTIEKLVHLISTPIQVFWWKNFFDIKVGKRTVIRGLKYINTNSGKIVIGDNCKINAIALAGPIEIGNYTLINLLSDISGRNYKVTIGNNVLIAPRVSIMASTHNYKKKNKYIREQGSSGGDVVIEDDVWVGTNAVILPGVKIGQGAVIGANAVVTHDIPEYAIALGVPAKVRGFRE